MATSLRGGRGRRTKNEINMVPFIDVMLVLLIIFMVSAPLITTGVVDVPTVGRARQLQGSKIDLTVAADGRLKIREGGSDQPVTLAQLAARVQAAQGGDAQVPVVIAADRGVRYENVMKVMDTLQKAGIQRVGLQVRSNGG